jgi:predicted RNA-binding protein with PUA-like domain
MQYWVMKTEPDTYSIDRLQIETATIWDGVRNYQARNYMMHSMCIGDGIFVYHSNCKHPGIVGEAIVTKRMLIDPSQFDSNSKYYDPRSHTDNPRWYCVEVTFVEKYTQPILLSELRVVNDLQSMPLLRPSNRLSITPVTLKEYQVIQKLRSS